MYSHFSNKHTLIYNLNFINFILVQEIGSRVKIPSFALAPNYQLLKNKISLGSLWKISI